MHHPIRSQPTEVDPIIMRRRAMIAALLGLPAAGALPAWAEAAARTPDGDHTITRGNWNDTFQRATSDLDQLAARYVTHEGVLSRHTIMDTALWLASQTNVLLDRAPTDRRHEAHRAAAEAAAFAAGCYLDVGNNRAATELYDKAFHLAQGHPDLRAFIWTQWTWVPMYTGQWRKVIRRSDQAIRMASDTGGFGLLMGWAHRAKASAVLGHRDEATEALGNLERAIPTVTGAEAPHSALRFSACKANFCASTVYAELGDRDRQNELQHRALADPSLGWIDRNLMQLANKALDPEPEYAAQRIRFQLLALPQEDFNHCIKAEATRQLDNIANQRGTNPEISAAQSYLKTVQVS